jgi:phage terminase large subunit GpA-like protein
MGQTASDAPWKELDKLLNEKWKLASGLYTDIRKMCVDSGYNTQHVYNWVRKHNSTGRVLAVKGSDALNTVLGHPKATEQKSDGKQLRRPVKVFPVGVSVVKQELYGWLQQDGAIDGEAYPTGYCHFPEYNEEYFKMLTAEELVKSSKNGKPVYKWVKVYKRNEALDCRVYARAAANNVGMDRFKDADWDALTGEQKAGQPPPPVKANSELIQPKPVQNQRPLVGLWKPNDQSLWRK